MNWIDIAWPMVSAASATLGLIHLLIWLRRRTQWASLAFAVAAMSLAVFAMFELMMMQAQTGGAYAALLRWGHVPITTLVLGIIAFVMLQFDAGNRYLAVLAALTRIGCLCANFLVGDNVNFLEVGELRQFEAWGATVSIPGADSIPNPWMALDFISDCLLLLFIASAIIDVRRNPPSPQRRRALLICLTIVFLALFSQLWNGAVIYRHLDAPLFFSPAFLFVLLGMAYEIGAAMLRANELTRHLADARLDLEQAQEQRVLVVKAANLGLWTWDIRTGAAWFSEHGLAVLGHEPGEEIDVGTLERRIEAGDRARFRKDVRDASRCGDLWGEYRAVYPGNRPGWLVIRGQVEFADDGTPLRLEGVFGDITERKSAEDRYRTLVWSAPTAILMFDEAGTIVLSNPSAEALFGYAPGELAGIRFDRLLPGYGTDSQLRSRPRLDAEALMAGVCEPAEAVGYDKNNAKLVLQVSQTPIPMASELLVLTMITDLTEARRLERESVVQRDELAHLSRVALLSQLSASLAHELNQPLTAILANAQAAQRFLDRDPPDLDEVRIGLQRIVESDKRAGDVIRKLRALLRKDSPDFRRLDANELATDVLEIIRSELLNRNIETILDLADGLPAVYGDKVQLQQVLLNLILNASDAMQGSEHRRLTLRTEVRSPGHVAVSVSDTGRGLPGDRSDIFAPFFTTKPEGLGLGLQVCRMIVSAHDGSLWATDNAGGGACVGFNLPVEGSEERADGANGEGLSATPARDAGGRGG